MKKANESCPCCSSSDVVRHEKIVRSNVTLGGEFYHADIYIYCNSCRQEIFLAEMDASYKKSKKEANDQMVIETIKELMSKNNISAPLFERVFELPFGTLSRWKDGRYSASSLALLRIVKSCPWIVRVADDRFKAESIIREIIVEANKIESGDA